MRALVIRRAWGDVEIVAPFDADFVERLKRYVPARHRRWDPDSKSWRISAAFVEDALSAADLCYDEVEFVAPGVRTHTLPECLDAIRRAYPAHSVLCLTPVAPPDLFHAAYRTLARLVHPDVSGPHNNGRMADINNAFSVLTRATTTSPTGRA